MLKTEVTREAIAALYANDVHTACLAIEDITYRRNMLLSMDGISAVVYDRIGGASSMEHGDDAVFSIIERRESLLASLEAQQNSAMDLVGEFGEMLSELPSDTAYLLEAHYIDGETWEQIAEHLTLSVRTVYNHRHFALLELYEAMRARGIT